MTITVRVPSRGYPASMTLPPSADVPGFLPDHEGEALHQLGLEAGHLGPILEIGSWCGRSTIWLAHAARATDSIVIALDHHRGSEEHQPGEFFHDESLMGSDGRVDTLSAFRRNIAEADVEDAVIPVVTRSAAFSRWWQGYFGMVFIDGGHSLDSALADWRSFGPRVAPGGILAIHDVYPEVNTGGQAPFTVWRLALESGLYEEVRRVDTLWALRRLPSM